MCQLLLFFSFPRPAQVVKSLSKNVCHHLFRGAFRSCHTPTPDLATVARHLKDLYRADRYPLRGPAHCLIRDATHNVLPCEENNRRKLNQLVHLQASPDFCRSRPLLGITGTSGRRCSLHAGGKHPLCSTFCCSKREVESVVVRPGRCNCDINFRFEMICQTCLRSIKLTVCA